MSGGPVLDMRIAAVETVTGHVKKFRLESASGAPLPAWSAGAHVVALLQDGGRAIRNPYSLMGAPGDAGGYEISVRLAENSRGGSRFLHHQAKVGDALRVSWPVNLFPLDLTARKHVLVAGGIGITPVMAMAAQLTAIGGNFELHYAARAPESAPYWQDLQQKYGWRVKIWFSGQGNRLPVDDILAHQPLGTHLYVCGPERLADEVLAQAVAAGWPAASLHCERFLAPPAGQPFTVSLTQSGKQVIVGEHESMLEAIEAAGVDAPYLCRGGACGQCETRVVACDGQLIHNDHYLSEADRAAGRKILPCVSRFQGKTLELAL